MSARPPVERLAWDSDFFGFGVGRVAAARLTSDEAAACARLARDLHLRCLYFLAGPDDPETWRAAIEAGFDPIDVRVELDRDLSKEVLPSPPASSRATAADIPGLLELAHGSFRQSRFFRDTRFPAEKAEELFSTWARSGVDGPGRFAFLHRVSGKIAGFVSARMASADAGRIELVAVSPAFQGKGVGARLLDETAAELAARGARTVVVVTQGSQTAAVRLYERAGFRTRSVGLWFHRWFS
jgi:dTDP-4-amino-4,6-dideoxy-D-galactose acyltransferase